MTTRLEATITSIAHGGQGVARIDGKVHFVPDALPGSTVAIAVTDDHDRWARGEILEVLEAGPFAAVPACRHAAVCGGCQWQHAALAAQRDWKRQVVAEQLERIGRIPQPPVNPTKVAGPAYGYRNRMDFVVGPGLALHRRRSNDLVVLEECPVLHPALEALISVSAFEGADRVTARVGTRTGDRLLVLDAELPSDAPAWGVPVCRVRSGRVEALIGDPWLHEVVVGMRFRVSGSAFFQNNTDGADVLAQLVATAAGRGGTLIDLYAGGGLFSCTIGRRFDRVVAVESAALAVDDFHHNAAGLDHVELHPVAVERAGDVLARHPGATVVADPPRAGLQRTGAAAVLRARPSTIVLVSCDPASLGRDARLLTEGGYRLVETTPLDLFPQTFHVEAVSRFERVVDDSEAVAPVT